MGRLMTLFADRLRPETAIANRLFNWQGDLSPSGQSVPLRLAGALHATALQGGPLRDVYPPHTVSDDALWSAVKETLIRDEAQLDRWLDSPPQTNEVRRSAVLIAAGRWLADRYGLPLVLSELGASAGLNLFWDRYALDVGGQIFGDPVATVRLAPDWQGPTPATSQPQVADRRGIDLNPLDPNQPADALRLRAYLWPDQPERRALTDAAIALATPSVDRGDVASWLEQRLSQTRKGHVHLIYHTIAWQYFPQESQKRATRAIESAGQKATADEPLAWFGMESDGTPGSAGLTLRLWPGDLVFKMGRAGFHGQHVEWTPPD